MRKYIFYGFTLAITWMFVTGSANLPTFVQGLFFGMPLSFAFRRFYPGELNTSKLERTPFLVEYVVIFIEALVVSNLEVAYRILNPSKSVEPEVIEYSSSLDHPTALAILADSITLTPGTLVLDHSEEENKMLIHCLNGGCEEETKKDIRKWEKILEKVYG